MAKINIDHFDDSKYNFILNKVKSKREKMADREGVFNKLMGLSGYIPLMCSKSPNYTLPEDLMSHALDFIFDQSNPY